MWSSVCVSNWYWGCVVWLNCEVVEIKNPPGTTLDLDSVTNSYMLFLPLLVFHHPLVLLRRWCPPSSMPLSQLNTKSPHPTLPPTCNCHPRGHLPTWKLLGSRYIVSLLYASLVSTMEYPLSTTVAPPCIPHIARLSYMACPGHPLIHALLIFHLFLHLGGHPSKKHSTMGLNHLQH